MIVLMRIRQSDTGVMIMGTVMMTINTYPKFILYL